MVSFGSIVAACSTNAARCAHFRASPSTAVDILLPRRCCLRPAISRWHSANCFFLYSSAARRKKAAALHVDIPRIVDVSKPSRYKAAKPAPALTQRIAEAKKKPSPLDEIDHEKAREAADRLWQEIVQAVKESVPDQPRSSTRGRGGNKRGKSGQ